MDPREGDEGPSGKDWDREDLGAGLVERSNGTRGPWVLLALDTSNEKVFKVLYLGWMAYEGRYYRPRSSRKKV